MGLEDGVSAGGTEELAVFVIGEELVQRLGQVVGVVGPEELSSTRRFDQFGKRAVGGLYDGHARGKRFEHENPFWFVIGGGNGEDIDRSVEVELLMAIDDAGVMEVTVGSLAEAGVS